MVIKARREHRLQVSAELRGLLERDLSDGTYAIGDRLPSEPELAESYGVSRPTLREVLSGLEREGFVRRVHGVGTFVARPTARVRSVLDLDVGVTEVAAASGAPIAIDVIRAVTEPVPGWIASHLDLAEGAPVLYVERVIRIDGQAAAHAVDVISDELIAAVGRPTYTGGSVYQFLEGACGIRLIGGDAEISPVLPTAHLARLLGCTRTTPLLRLDQTEHDSAGHPVLFSQEHYPAGIVNMTVRRLRHDRADGTAMAQATERVGDSQPTE